MAAPITSIHKHVPTEEEIKQQKLDDLKTLFADNEDSLNKLFNIIGELNNVGVLEATDSLLQAKDQVAKIALGQVSREPVTNLINTLMGATGAMMSADPQQTTKLVSSAMTGMDEAHNFLQMNKKVGVLDLMKTLNDPDINRAVGFGIHFLKGMGRELKE
ncbi:DUF1641 domain-containing protein [Bacillus fonticola]|uniref:DUF1641 domain-containing protein n=1 Tax=Bacillus fonticola TaxID=2728853 RepID=UPI001472C676|nr:DUF1641 domain-containing protein [Bacillus fonticola]